MNKNPYQSKSALASRVDELREALKDIPVNLLADRTGSNYQALGPDRAVIVVIDQTIASVRYRVSDVGVGAIVARADQ